MDDSMLTSAGLSTSGVAILLILYRVLKTAKGKKLVSSCCGRKMEMGVDVQDMTPGAAPVDTAITIRNPVKQNESSDSKSVDCI